MNSGIHAGEWDAAPDYVCRICKERAFVNRDDKYQWGCKTCGYVTTAVFVYFKVKPNEPGPEMPLQTGDLSS